MKRMIYIVFEQKSPLEMVSDRTNIKAFSYRGDAEALIIELEKTERERRNKEPFFSERIEYFTEELDFIDAPSFEELQKESNDLAKKMELI